MFDTLVNDVARKSAKAKPPIDPEDKDRKPMAVQIRGDAAWKHWIDELSTFDERPVATLVERALREYAERAGFPKAPPKR